MQVTRAELSRRVDRAMCRVFGWQDASNDGHRAVVVALIEAFDTSESILLIEPSLSRKTNRPPDVVLVDPELGVLVIEVKAVAIEQIESIEPGGVLRILYRGSIRPRNVIAQVRSAMFDIKDATARAFSGNLSMPFNYRVAVPTINRDEWQARFGSNGYCPNEFMFADDLDRPALLRHVHATDRLRDARSPIRTCSIEQLQCVWTAFGDNSVLYLRSDQRPDRKVEEGTLGDFFDHQAAMLKNLSADQQRLSEMHWENGPRLVRGVAGSGKTIVLANNLARRVKRLLTQTSGDLFASPPRRPRIAAICFNRTLAPFIQDKIKLAYEQRTGLPLPTDIVQTCSLNTLMHQLSKMGLWEYQKVAEGDETSRAQRYLEQLSRFKADQPSAFERIEFDAIYIDEGQDFVDAEFELLRDLCRTTPGGEPSLFIFYDDAQNLYGHSRPNFASLGLNIRGGRGFVLNECFRNPQPIVEISFNVLYGTAMPTRQAVPTKAFGDVSYLQERGLIFSENRRWRVKFAPRPGRKPILTLADDPRREMQLILARLAILLRDERVRPQDIMVLAFRKERALAIAEAIERANIDGIDGVHLAFKQKDAALCPPRRVTVSTVHSAKGYDSFVVLLASANEFSTDITGRATFHVACTRAIEKLEVFAYRPTGLASELKQLLS